MWAGLQVTQVPLATIHLEHLASQRIKHYSTWLIPYPVSFYSYNALLGAEPFLPIATKDPL